MENYKNIPAGLKDMKQWVCFKLEPNEKKGKPDKVPYDPRTGRRAKANDPATWCDYQTAVNAVRRGDYDGIGFEFANGVFGVDLDNVIEGGELSPEAQDIITTLDSYTEYSPSGTGVHILCKGTIPAKDRRKGFIEMYADGRFFTVTGKILGRPKELNERTAQAAAVHAKYLARPEQPQAKVTAQTGLSMSDSELIAMACNGANGARFKALWNGDTSAYGGDHSRADQALVNDLAYWTNGNAYRMDALFRQSGLMRPKWDERRGSDTYGNITIAKALESFTPYVPRSSAADDFRAEKRTAPSAATPGTVQGNIAEQANTTDNTEYHEKPIISSENPRPDAINTYLEANFIKDIKRFIGFKDRKTGFENLDKQCGGLYPGLYVIGAISSLGKTTFVHQLGDQLAAAGDHVLFFSLEQNRLEMVTKSLSRITARHNKNTAVSAINIRSGKLTKEVIAAAEEYNAIADRVSIVECNFNTNINFILSYTRAYMAANPGVKPIVIVDYLQIIPPTDPRQSDKEKVDHIVRGLKKLQSDNDLVIFVVSSINRANYLSPIDFESFKESGGIEYTADVVWGLQLQILNDDLFNKPTEIKQKREKVREAKKANPRKIELLCLKNRYGVSSYSCGFIYTPQFDLFEVDYNYKDDDEKPVSNKRR